MVLADARKEKDRLIRSYTEESKIGIDLKSVEKDKGEN